MGFGGTPVSLIVIELTTVTVCVTLSLGAAVALAVRFTPPRGTVFGAVYAVPSPLAV
jgi:hypothetical protein